MLAADVYGYCFAAWTWQQGTDLVCNTDCAVLQAMQLPHS